LYSSGLDREVPSLGQKWSDPSSHTNSPWMRGGLQYSHGIFHFGAIGIYFPLDSKKSVSGAFLGAISVRESWQGAMEMVFRQRACRFA
jgi:hypothetical protein